MSPQLIFDAGAAEPDAAVLEDINFKGNEDALFKSFFTQKVIAACNENAARNYPNSAGGPHPELVQLPCTSVFCISFMCEF